MGRKPRLELHNFLNIDPEVKKKFILEKPDTLPIYTFGGSGGDTDQLIMKTPRKSKRTVSNEYPFYFLERKLAKGKFEGPYKNQPIKAIRGNEHTVTTEDGRTIHRKRISKPLRMFQEGPSMRGTNPRDSEGRWMRPLEREQEDEIPGPSNSYDSSNPTYILPETPTAFEEEPAARETATETTGHNPNGIGRGVRRKLIRSRENSTTTPHLKSDTEESRSRANWRVDATVMTSPQFEETRMDIKENPTEMTTIEENGNVNLENNLKTELVGEGEEVRNNDSEILEELPT